jgi:hypothetical protein
VFLCEICLVSSCFPCSYSKYLTTIRQQKRARKGKTLKIRPGESTSPWTLSVKFPYDTQFIFGSLMLVTGEDGDLKLLTRGLVPNHQWPVYGQAPYYPADPSKSSVSTSACLGLNPYAWSYHLSAMTSQGYSIATLIFQSLVGTSSSSPLGASRSKFYWRLSWNQRQRMLEP